MFILRTLSVLALGSFALAGDPPKPVEKKPDASQLAKDLGSPVFAERDRASRELWKLGIAARPAIEKAANSDDPEVAQRANDILEKFVWGIFPDTPAGVLKQIKEFRSNDLERQTVAVSALIGIEVRGVETLALVLARDLEPERRTELYRHLLSESRDAVPILMFREAWTRAEAILELEIHAVQRIGNPADTAFAEGHAQMRITLKHPRAHHAGDNMNQAHLKG